MRVSAKIMLTIAVLGTGLAVLSACLMLAGSNYSEAVGTAGTIISIVLGVYSILYTYKSGEETIKVLQDIREENASLVNWIHDTMARDNFDSQNVESVEMRIKNRANECT